MNTVGYYLLAGKFDFRSYKEGFGFWQKRSLKDDRFKLSSDDEKKVDEEKENSVNSTNNVNTVSLTVNVVGVNRVNDVGELPFDPDMTTLKDISTFNFFNEDKDDDEEADINNLDTTIHVSPAPTIRIHEDHPLDQVIRDLRSATQTRNMTKSLEEHGFVITIQQRTNHKDLQNCLFSCFLSQEEPKKVIHALKDPRWIEAMLMVLGVNGGSRGEWCGVVREAGKYGTRANGSGGEWWKSWGMVWSGERGGKIWNEGMEMIRLSCGIKSQAGSESHPPMLNKENYVPWSSRLLRYAKSRPNGKLIHNSILNGPYVKKMIPEPGDANHEITITKTLYLQTDDELTNKELKHIEADDQAIQTILLGLPEDIYAVPEWSRHVTIVHQTKDLHTADYTQLYDFLKYNQKKVDELKAKRLAKTQDPLALMANSNNPYVFLTPHQDQSSFNQNYLQQPMTNPEDITDPTTAMNMVLALMAKAFKLNYSTPINNNQRISSNPRNRQIAQPGMNMGQDRQIQMVGECCSESKGLECSKSESDWEWGVGHYARNCMLRPRRRDAAYLQTQLLIAQKEEAEIQLQAEEYDLMVAVADLDEIKKVNANCILMANLQQALASGTQTDSAPVYDTDESAEVIQICLWCVDSGCSKHMTGNLKLLINFVWKFLGTVRFGNDHVAAILGFGDLQWGNILITWVYFVEGMGHNLFSVGPDIVHATYLCARYKAKPTEKHLKEVKRIFHYLWGTVNTGLWYTKDSGFELTGFSDADYARCKDTFKSTFGGAQFLVKSWRSLSPNELERLAKSQVILFSIHSDEWKSFQSQHQTALRIRRWRYNLTPAESKFKTPMLDHQDKYMMKAQVHVLKSSAISDEQPLPRRKHYCQIYQVIKHSDENDKVINDLIDEIIPCSDLSSRNVPALSAKRP
nr:uncharacterized mitochondrial protein AtMg00810-like [Tanacetum cinerariifolium]